MGMAGSAFPVVSARSVLKWKSVFKAVNTFSIGEEEVVDDRVPVARPLYYCELHGASLKEAFKRAAMSKPRREKKH
jgi:hypothetical protein